MKPSRIGHFYDREMGMGAERCTPVKVQSFVLHADHAKELCVYGDFLANSGNPREQDVEERHAIM